MSRPITTVVFDCFGVLYQDAFKQFLDDHAATMPQPRRHYYDLAKQNELGYLSDSEFYKVFSDDTGIPAEQIKNYFNDTDCLNTNVVTLLEQIRETGKFKTAMLTNVERGFLQRFLDSHGIGHLFDVVLASSETAHVKPEREIFEALADRIETPFEEWYFIDDSSDNVEAAASYGIRGHVFTTTDELRKALSDSGII
jgi:HAD superfamily hydrolase (TIGR01509 family)